MPNPLKLKAILIDLNGTLHLGHDPTPNGIRALERLRAARFPFIFCLLAKLKGMGFGVTQEEVMTSLGACRQLVEDRRLRPFLLLSPSAKEEFAHLPTSSPADYDTVILGLHDKSLSYGPLNTAFRILKGEPIAHEPAEHDPRAYNPSSSSPRASAASDSPFSPSSSPHLHSAPQRSRQPTLLAPHASLYHQSPSTPTLPAGLSLGIGPFVRALELASGVQAELVGKPTRRFFELAIERVRGLYGLGAEVGGGEVGVVGDDVMNDLGEGAEELGLRRILVRTGKYRPEDEHGARDGPPDRVYDSFADFVDDLL